MKRILGFLLLCWLGSPLLAAGLDITVSGGREDAIPIAVVPFGWTGGGEEPLYNIGQIIAADLQRSGRFRPLPENDLVARPTRGQQINFSDWRRLGVNYLVVGMVRPGPGGYEVRFELFDGVKQTVTLQSRCSHKTLRSKAHQIADIIYEKLTGQPGAFNTKVAYITEEVRGDRREIALQIADADGYEPHTIVASSEPLMSPAWSPDGRKIAYVSFERGQPSIYVQDLATGQRIKVASYPGINGAPAWSPNGRYLSMTLSKDGNPDIYIYELGSGSLRQLTHHYAIDTESAWSPDGQSLVFTSDRGGKQQVYMTSMNGGEPRRITYKGDSNARASFAPDGKALVVETQTGRGYAIGVVNLANGDLQVLTDGAYDESPSFAPNGSMIIYATKANGKGELAAVSADGRYKQRLLLKSGEVREPDWSPKVR